MEGHVVRAPAAEAAPCHGAAEDSHEQLRRLEECDHLGEVRGKQAESEEAAAGKAATQKWISWMYEGSAVGLGRQHTMSKVA